VLVVGPNPVFLRYISQVLPSLGETSATQTTVDGLLALRFRIAAEDALPVAAIKGDARLAEVIARGAADAVRVPADGMTVRFRTRRLTLEADDVREIVDEARRRDAPFATQRERFRKSVVRRAYDRYTGGVAIELDENDFGAALLADAESRKAIDACWRSVSPVGLVRSLLTQRAFLARAAAGVLSDDEQRAILRPRDRADAWTADDLPLIDAAEAFVRGAPRRFGHVVVDEAQDLSPMQLRMLARRAQRHSMTVLGDLAQATGPASPSSWEATLGHLGRPVNAQPAELTMGYRLPGAFLALANRLLPTAAPGVAASQSVRADGDPPDTHEFAPDQLVPAVAEHALALAKEFGTVAVVAADGRVDALRRAIEDRGVVLAEPGEVDPDRPLVVLAARLAKGLEFDAVIVAEPAEIAEEEPHGVRLLFVALTRAVQHLALAHARPLPAALVDAGVDEDA
jgi:DNA helicase IV